MSDSASSALLAYPVSTRTATTRSRGLSAGLDELFKLHPPGFAVQADGPVTDADRVCTALAGTGRPVLAVVGALAGETWRTPARFDAADAEEGRAAAAHLLSTLHRLSKLRCRRLVIPVGCGDVTGSDAMRIQLADAEDPAAHVRTWKAETGSEREQAIDRLIRRLDGLARREGAVRFLLVPSEDPLSLLDAEAASWVLEDSPCTNVSLALDLGRVAVQGALGGAGLPAWLELLAGRTDLVLLSDHDGELGSNLLPGSGTLDFSELSGALPRSAPWILHGCPSVPEVFLRESSRFLEGRLGPAPDPDALR